MSQRQIKLQPAGLRSLRAFQLAKRLSHLIYDITSDLPKSEFRLIGQMRGAAVSVFGNIAEGYGRWHHRDKIKFYYNSRSSLLESKHWTLLLGKRQLITNSEYKTMMNKLNILHKKLNTYIKSCSRQI